MAHSAIPFGHPVEMSRSSSHNPLARAFLTCFLVFCFTKPALAYNKRVAVVGSFSETSKLETLLNQLAANTRSTGLPLIPIPDQKPESETVSVGIEVLAAVNAETSQPVLATQPVAEKDDAEPAAQPRSTAAASSPRMTSRTDDWVPEGFEDLNQAVVNEVDVYYGGYYLTSVLASFSRTMITFLAPEQLAQTVRDLETPEQFEALLAEPLYANPELICGSRYSIDCGKLQTESVEVIFDVSKLRADLFIGSRFLKLRTLDQLEYLPASDAGFSILDDFSLNFSGDNGDDSDWRYNLSNITMLSSGEQRVLMRSNYADQELKVEQLAFQREFRGRDLRVGLMRENAGNFRLMKDRLFRGVAYQSSLTTRRNLDFALGSEVNLFLDSRSRVEIYKDGRLQASDYYDIGNQIIDTSNLPDGSYPIEIRIINNANEERVEERFYSKTSQLPPADQMLYFLQVGQDLLEEEGSTLPKETGTEFLRAGLSRRVSDTLGGYAGLSVDQDSQMIETGFFKQGEKFELQALFGYDSYKVSAFDIALRYRFDFGDLRLNSRKISDEKIPFGEQSQIGRSIEQQNVNLSVRSRIGNFSFFYRRNVRDEDGAEENFGLRWNANRLFGIRGLSTRFELSENDGSQLAVLSLDYRIQGRSFDGSVRSRWQQEDESDGQKIRERREEYNVTWKKGESGENQYRLGLNANIDEEKTYEARLQASTHLGKAEITAQYRDSNNLINYNGSVKSTLGFTHGQLALGGKRQSNAGFLVNVKNPGLDKAPVDILVNNQKVAEIEAGRKLFVPVSTYRTHELRLLPAGDQLAQIEQRPISKTFYPGNVIPVEITIDSVFVVIGRVSDSNGSIVDNALVENAASLALTDDSGFLQAELKRGSTEIVLRKGSRRCTIPLAKVDVKEDVAYLGALTCAWTKETE